MTPLLARTSVARMVAGTAVVSVIVRLRLIVMVWAATVDPSRAVVARVANGVPNGIALDRTCAGNTC